MDSFTRNMVIGIYIDYISSTNCYKIRTYFQIAQTLNHVPNPPVSYGNMQYTTHL